MKRTPIATAVLGAALAAGGMTAAPHVLPRPRIELLYGTPTPHYTERAGYVTAYDPARKCPAWTLHYLDNERVAHRAARAAFRQDDSLPAECRTTLRDYEGTALHDRGHCVPAADCDWSAAAAIDASRLSNVAPQCSSLNRGPWNQLEQHIREIAARKNTEVWIITGTLLAPDPLPKVSEPTNLAYTTQFMGRSHITVPSHFYKAVLVRCGEAIELIAWVAPNRPYEVADPVREWRVATDVVEHWAGCDFWSGLPDAIEVELEARR